jgi:O-glycosyl hydrolase
MLKNKVRFTGILSVLPVFVMILAGCLADGKGRAAKTDAAAQAVIAVDTSPRYQKITGFGGMSQVWTSPELTVEDIDIMFSPDGLGYNIFRICLYPYMDDVLSNREFPNRDNSDYYELAKRVKQYGGLVLASPWTPPAEWKTGGTRKGGEGLKREHYGDYLQHLMDYVAEMQRNGVELDAISYQNEPDWPADYDGCDWTPEQMLDFVKYAKRSIQDAYPFLKVMPGESLQFRTESYTSILNDSEARNYVDIIGGHLYGGGMFKHTLPRQYGKEVWMTERNMNTKENYAYDSTWEAVWLMTDEVHNSMINDFNAYIWWYAKRFYSMIGDGEYETVEHQVLPRGWMLSHYAKYATGKTRVGAELTTSLAGIYVTAYEGDDDISLVMFNKGETNADVLNITLPYAAQSASAVITRQIEGRSIAGMESAAVSLSADKKTGTLSLPAQSIMSVKFVK